MTRELKVALAVVLTLAAVAIVYLMRLQEPAASMPVGAANVASPLATLTNAPVSVTDYHTIVTPVALLEDDHVFDADKQIPGLRLADPRTISLGSLVEVLGRHHMDANSTLGLKAADFARIRLIRSNGPVTIPVTVGEGYGYLAIQAQPGEVGWTGACMVSGERSC